MEWYDIFGWIGAAGLICSFIPDIIMKLYKHQKPDFSCPFMGIRFITTISFLVWGIGINKPQAIVANAFVLISLDILVIMFFEFFKLAKNEIYVL